MPPRAGARRLKGPEGRNLHQRQEPVAFSRPQLPWQKRENMLESSTWEWTETLKNPVSQMRQWRVTRGAKPPNLLPVTATEHSGCFPTAGPTALAPFPATLRRRVCVQEGEAVD